MADEIVETPPTPEPPVVEHHEIVAEVKEELRAEQERIENAEAAAHEEGRREAEEEAFRSAEIAQARAETESVRAEFSARIAEQAARIAELEAQLAEDEVDEEITAQADAVDVAAAVAAEIPPDEEHRLEADESPHRRKKKFVRLFG